ncbi:unnamed protein product [Nippostrongylus brasiliensis]|uniref:L-lactate permease n=1 Tax=Nippostrongylus brasiliensis TaxID=27835 RepID=A0A0N4YRM2_NIPBR|nr:unnamed protein product [Nippostrongylus brasiliensis]
MFASIGGGAAFTRWWHLLAGLFSPTIPAEFDSDANQLIRNDTEEYEMFSKGQSHREPKQLSNNSASVIAVALITLAIVMWAYVL